MKDNVDVPAARRATISFMPRAVADLDWLVEQTGFNQTDAANRAVQLYAMIERGFAEGKKLAFLCPDKTVEGITII